MSSGVTIWAVTLSKLGRETGNFRGKLSPGMCGGTSEGISRSPCRMTSSYVQWLGLSFVPLSALWLTHTNNTQRQLLTSYTISSANRAKN